MEVLEENSIDGSFYRAILSIHRSKFEEAQKFIDISRDLLDADLAALIGESYDRAYKCKDNFFKCMI